MLEAAAAASWQQEDILLETPRRRQKAIMLARSLSPAAAPPPVAAAPPRLPPRPRPSRRFDRVNVVKGIHIAVYLLREKFMPFFYLVDLDKYLISDLNI